MRSVILIASFFLISVPISIGQDNGSITILDTIPAEQLEFTSVDSLNVIPWETILAKRLGQDSILVHDGRGYSVQLYLVNDNGIRSAEIGLPFDLTKRFDLYGYKSMKYSAKVDSLGTDQPFLLLNWKSEVCSTSGLCFGDSGMTTNKTTHTKRGITIIDLHHLTHVFTGLTHASKSHSNINEGGFGYNSPMIVLHPEEHTLKLQHFDFTTEKNDHMAVVGVTTNKFGNNRLEYYNYTYNEDHLYQLINRQFVRMK